MFEWLQNPQSGFNKFIQNPATMQMAAGLLAAPRDQRFSQSLGQGLQAYQQGLLAQQDAAMQNQLRNLQMQKLQAEIGQIGAPGERKIIKGADGFQYYADTGERVLPGVTVAHYDLPMSVKEWEYFEKLPKDDQQRYLSMKRQEQFLNLGGSYAQPMPGVPGAISSEFAKTVPPEQQPDLKAAQAAATTGATIKAKEEAEAKSTLPQYMADAEEQIQLIDEMLSHPGLGYAVGKTSVMPIVPGTDAKDFVARLDQLKGKQFMEAYKTLKGGGQITEVEGKKATEALARMDRGTSEREFKKASRDFQKIIIKGLERAKMKAKYGVNKRTTPGEVTPKKPMKSYYFDAQGNLIP